MWGKENAFFTITDCTVPKVRQRTENGATWSGDFPVILGNKESFPQGVPGKLLFKPPPPHYFRKSALLIGNVINQY
jgi:hypothetical protein